MIINRRDKFLHQIEGSQKRKNHDFRGQRVRSAFTDVVPSCRDISSPSEQQRLLLRQQFNRLLGKTRGGEGRREKKNEFVSQLQGSNGADAKLMT